MDDVFLRVIELENTKAKSLEDAQASMNADMKTLAVVRTSRANSVASIYNKVSFLGFGLKLLD